MQEQKDSLQVLKAAIRSKQPHNFYIFHGEEVFLLQHYLGQLHKVILDELTESFNLHRFNHENFDLRDFSDAVENLPMMAERTLVQVEDIDIFKLPEDSRSKMIDILSDIPEYCTVIFVYETVEFKPDKRLKKLWEAVSKAEIVEFTKQSQRDLISWITRHFAAKGKYISPELCLYLLELTDGNGNNATVRYDKRIVDITALQDGLSGKADKRKVSFVTYTADIVIDNIGRKLRGSFLKSVDNCINNCSLTRSWSSSNNRNTTISYYLLCN